jgi:hypothetical protein
MTVQPTTGLAASLSRRWRVFLIQWIAMLILAGPAFARPGTLAASLGCFVRPARP